MILDIPFPNNFRTTLNLKALIPVFARYKVGKRVGSVVFCLDSVLLLYLEWLQPELICCHWAWDELHGVDWLYLLNTRTPKSLSLPNRKVQPFPQSREIMISPGFGISAALSS